MGWDGYCVVLCFWAGSITSTKNRVSAISTLIRIRYMVRVGLGLGLDLG